MKTLLALLAVAPALLTGCAPPEKSPEGPQTSSATLGTNRVHYVTVGKGPTTFVFIHGWACNNAFWREQIPALTDKARLVLVDLPGHGQSDAPSTRYTMDYFASAVRAVMDDAGVDRAVLVGHSMGVPVICRVYAQDPGRVAGLVAVDGVLHRPDLPPERQEGMAQFAASLRGGEYREPLREFINAMFTSPDSTAVRDWVYEEAVRTPQQVMVSAMECMFDPTEPNWDLKRVDFPVLAIHAPSPMWTEEYETFVQGLSDQADYRTIDGVGHFLMLEKPVEFNVTLIEMLLECGLMTD